MQVGTLCSLAMESQWWYDLKQYGWNYYNYRHKLIAMQVLVLLLGQVGGTGTLGHGLGVDLICGL